MEQKILITLYIDQVAPRFDLTTEVSIVSIADDGRPTDKKKDRGFTTGVGRTALSSCSFGKNQHGGVWWN